jgi:hypothetical protein
LKGRFQTRYSTVYDLGGGTVDVFGADGDEPVAVLDLEEELYKGSHYYDLAKIGEQLSGPQMVDHKTASSVAVSAAADVTGTYRGSGNALKAVRIAEEGGRLYLWPVAGQQRRFRLDAISEDVFVLRSIAGSFTARRDADGDVVALLMEQAGHENLLEKVGGADASP